MPLSGYWVPGSAVWPTHPLVFKVVSAVTREVSPCRRFVPAGPGMTEKAPGHIRRASDTTLVTGGSRREWGGFLWTHLTAMSG